MPLDVSTPLRVFFCGVKIIWPNHTIEHVIMKEWYG